MNLKEDKYKDVLSLRYSDTTSTVCKSCFKSEYESDTQKSGGFQKSVSPDLQLYAQRVRNTHVLPMRPRISLDFLAQKDSTYCSALVRVLTPDTTRR